MERKLIQKAEACLSSEKGIIRKSWDEKIPIALVYPNRYYTGMPNLGFQILYHMLNEPQDVLCERVFLPDKEDLDEYRRTKTLLRSLESNRKLSEFFLIAFSISFENDYLNVLKILELAGIPLLRSERPEHYPLILAGGITVFLNPEPLSDFIDLFAIGEGEAILPDILGVMRSAKGQRIKKEDLIEGLCQVDGIYAPSQYEVHYDQKGSIKAFLSKGVAPFRVRRRVVKRIDRTTIPSSAVISSDTVFGDMVLMEVSRGCQRGCRFCAAGYVYHPPRHRALSGLIEKARSSLAHRKKIGLIAPSICDYPYLRELCESILSESGLISLTSLRLDALDERILKLLHQSGHKTVTLAPEAGSQRLRRTIRKSFTDEDISKAVELLVKNNIPNIRLYFMIGLPTETDEDVEGIVLLAKKVRHHFLRYSKEKRRLGRLTLSVSPFVPKPSTPFQWHPFEDIKALKTKIKTIEKGLRGESNIKVLCEFPKWSYIQALLSRGDRKVGQILLKAHKLEGQWQKAFEAININPDFYVTRQREEKEIFPWDFIDHGFDKMTLWREYQKAIRG